MISIPTGDPSPFCFSRGAFSYVKRVTQKANKAEFAAKFISARAKRKTSALREMRLLLRLEHERIIYFHDAFEKKNVIVIVTELYPCGFFIVFPGNETQHDCLAQITYHLTGDKVLLPAVN